MRLLICDRHTVFAQALAYMMTARGHDAVVVGSSDDAVAVIGRGVTDVCVVDPDLGGTVDTAGLTDICRALPRVHVAVLTTKLDLSLRAVAVREGARCVAEKTEPTEEILRLLDRVNDGEYLTHRIPRRSPPPELSNAQKDLHRLATSLSPRERQVLGALVRGDDTPKLAKSLGISMTTARCHIQNVLIKMGAHSRLEVATAAVRTGIVNPQTGEWVGAPA